MERVVGSDSSIETESSTGSERGTRRTRRHSQWPKRIVAWVRSHSFSSRSQTETTLSTTRRHGGAPNNRSARSWMPPRLSTRVSRRSARNGSHSGYLVQEEWPSAARSPASSCGRSTSRRVRVTQLPIIRSVPSEGLTVSDGRMEECRSNNSSEASGDWPRFHGDTSSDPRQHDFLFRSGPSAIMKHS